ncbi:hypothetical protein EGJ27_17835 [Pseudomonas sp. v388]|uniref:Ig-like domain-containing protein n=1 Tax=Pseudomonas sp. v388 TaxID=2479849 RepID=UPI000F771957|nr:Ig-like domain-containing protein [Pseudomonas sp. v388]RRV05671.1 hypothetical protein EGJ27_17835 [Pseudomonas sp. v388]
MLKINNSLHSKLTKFIDENLTPAKVDVALNADGLLPVSSLTSPIRVTFPAWAAVMAGIRYQLLWDDTLVGEEKVVAPGTRPGDTLFLHIPVEVLSEGKHSLSYQLTNPENGSTSEAPPSPIEVDLTPPGSPILAPVLFPDLIRDGLTSDELDGLNNVLPGTIASYQGMKEGDTIRTYWNRIPGPTAVVSRDDMGLRRVVIGFQRTFLEGIGDIEAPVHYTVADLAGNLSMVSEPVSVKLQLSVVPPLPAPRIKEANGDILDPVNAPDGATVVVDASAALRVGDRVFVVWQGPKGYGDKDLIITEAQAGKALAVVFAPNLVTDNAGESVQVVYGVYRVNGVVQRSPTVIVKILASLTELPAPRMDTVGADGVVNLSLIPDSGATIRVRYPDLGAQDRVVVNWRGASSYDTPEQVGGAGELSFNLPKALLVATANAAAIVTYTVTRGGTARVSAPLGLTVRSGLQLDTSPVTLGGKVYLLPGTPDLLPDFPTGTSIQRVASGGQAPYTYASSNTLIAKVDANGLTTVRGNGKATISVTDAAGDHKSFEVTVTGVIHCLGVGKGSLAQMTAAAAGQGGRIPSITELKEIYITYGSRWPMGNGNYWSSTVAAESLVGMKWYFVKNLVTGMDFKLLHHNASLGVAIR